MGRPRSITRKHFMRIYREEDTVNAMAERLDVTRPTIYNYCKRFNVSPPHETVTTKITVKQLKAALKISDTMTGIASILGVTRQTVRRYMEKHKFELNSNSIQNQTLVNLLRQYRSSVTIRDLANKHNMSASQVKRDIREAIPHAFVSLPPINLLSDVKIANEIRIDSTLLDDPERLCEITGLPSSQVESYIHRCLEGE